MNSSKNIKVPFIGSVSQNSSLEYVSSALNYMSKNAISNAPWLEFPYKPDCSFAMAHGNDCVFLKFYIKEDAVLAQFTQPNDMVYQDSCVEFFIAFDDEAEYYNLEFNCLGTGYVAYGLKREGREVAPVNVVKKIKSNSLLYTDNGKIRWELTLMIPAEVFYHHNFTSLASKACRANFFKCGDSLPTPHYLSWNNIESENPNFHLSEFFGNITFNEALTYQMMSSSI